MISVKFDGSGKKPFLKQKKKKKKREKDRGRGGGPIGSRNALSVWFGVGRGLRGMGSCKYYSGQKNWDSHAPAGTGA